MDQRFIPAWAGNTRTGGRRHFWGPVHPRVGGEHLAYVTLWQCYYGSSPRGRGTLSPMMLKACQPRFIPAWAGNTLAGTH